MADEKVIDEDSCPDSPDGKYEPNWNTISRECDVESYIDVSCTHCGRSGCVGTATVLAEGIQW